MEMIELKDLKEGKNYFSKPVTTIHSFYLYGIEEAEKYVEWFEIMRNAGPHDAIRIHINSYGGDLFTAIQFLRVMTESQATFIASVEGACMSAATIIFLCSDMFEISEHSMFMFHNYSGGTFGKGGEMLDQLKHERVWSEKLMRSIYNEFLTPKEIESMLDNKDIWMDGDEVMNRLNKRNKKVNKSTKAHKPKAPQLPEEMINT